MRRIVIGDTGWLTSFRRRARAEIVRAIFSLAAENGYDISVQGQHWPN